MPESVGLGDGIGLCSEAGDGVGTGLEGGGAVWLGIGAADAANVGVGGTIDRVGVGNRETAGD